MKGRIRNGRKAVNPPEQRRVLLSLDRATAIKNWFQTWADEKGIDGWTLLVDGKGKTELKAPDTNVEGTFLEDAGALNRRVEIKIELDE
jgi:outer membrane protein OmpA-like peptidoglycan-associated protein